jgi:predicted ATPase/DNA-binding SARP family transcriptional activator
MSRWRAGDYGCSVIVRILGPLEVDGAAVGGGRLRALLARLALDAGKPVTAGALVDAVWDNDLPADQTHSLQSLVSRLRRALGEAEAVAQVPGGYVLTAEVDAHRFERLAAEGAAEPSPERSAQMLREALELWRGPALADLTDYRFAVNAAGRLEDLRLSALADRIDADLQLGRGDRLVHELEGLSGAHPLNERLAAQLITALFAAGRQADALAAYERVRVRLDEELGVPPSPELQAAHLAVLRGETTKAEPPRSTSRSNLPAPVTSFVGREREIEHIGELLERSRLVTLVGPGGAGKTRLARETVSGWVDRVADGVWMVELAPVTADVEIVPAVLGVFGVREATVSDRPLPARDTLERLLDILGDREAILVLDNCEHLIAPVAELTETLLAACPRLRVVATSREALAIAGESLAPVPPLGLPADGATAAEALQHPAIRLFADRAAAALPGFAVDEETVGPTIEICRRLDGLPLALELAAARLRSLLLADLAARLDDRFRLLTGGSRTALARHRTLRAVVDWSWELLPEEERRLARRLAVFPAGATVESASAVLGADAFDGLVALVDRSLLQLVPGTAPVRYRMLETIREYGLERLEEADELDSARAAHARYFAELAETAEPRLRRPGQKEWFARLQDERENILAGLRYLGDSGDARGAIHLAVTLLWFWLLSGSQTETTAWLDFALGVDGESDPEERLIAATIREFESLTHAESAEEMRANMSAVLRRVETIDDRRFPLVAVARPVMALFAGEQDRVAAFQAAGEAHPDPWVRAALHLLDAGRAENDGDVPQMRVALQKARTAFAEVGDNWGLAMSLFLDTGRLLLAGELEAARTGIEEAQEALSGLNPDTGGGMFDVRMADVLLRLGDIDEARARARRARDRRDAGSDDTAFAQATLARIAWVSGDSEGARAELADARERLERRGRVLPEQSHGWALIQSLSAILAAEAGDLEAAEGYLATGLPLAMATTDMPVVSSVAAAAAHVAAARGKPDEAAELLGAAAAIRGADDFTSPEIAAIRDEARSAAYDRGRGLSREEALARLEASASRAAPVGP